MIQFCFVQVLVQPASFVFESTPVESSAAVVHGSCKPEAEVAGEQRAKKAASPMPDTNKGHHLIYYPLAPCKARGPWHEPMHVVRAPKCTGGNEAECLDGCDVFTYRHIFMLLRVGTCTFRPGILPFGMIRLLLVGQVGAEKVQCQRIQAVGSSSRITYPM